MLNTKLGAALFLCFAAAPTLAARVQVRSESGLMIKAGVGTSNVRMVKQQWFDLKPDRSVDGVLNLYWTEPAAGGNQNVYTPRCAFKGKLDEGYDEIAWIVLAQKSYLHPCGNHHGLWLDCGAPASTCDFVQKFDFNDAPI